jgi:hypothetical protein
LGFGKNIYIFRRDMRINFFKKETKGFIMMKKIFCMFVFLMAVNIWENLRTAGERGLGHSPWQMEKYMKWKTEG